MMAGISSIAAGRAASPAIAQNRIDADIVAQLITSSHRT